MSFKKIAAIAVAVGALAAVSVPAMAFENEFHGIYNLKFFLSNVENGNGGANAIGPTAFSDKMKTNNYFEQRARIFYTAKASDDLKLVTGFELDSKFGGDKSGKYGGASNDAGGFDADGISLETKWVYLDFNLGKSLNVRTGIQPIKDSFKGIFADIDAAGITTKATFGPSTLALGYYRTKTESSLAQTTGGVNFFTNISQIGHENQDIFMLDAKYAVSKDINVGFAYYLMSDYAGTACAVALVNGACPTGQSIAASTANGGVANTTQAVSFVTPTTSNVTVHAFGINADAKLGPATVSGFLAAQYGFKGNAAKRQSISAYAANAAAKMAVGPGTFKTALLYESGDGDANGNAHNTNWVGIGAGTTYAEGGMFLLYRTGVGGTNTDRTIIGATGPGTPGAWLYTLGYDANITPKFFANANVGMLWAAKNSGAPLDKALAKANGTNYKGTEVNFETGYKVFDNLTAKIQAAYVMLGGYYKNTSTNYIPPTATPGKATSPENPYTVRTCLAYSF